MKRNFVIVFIVMGALGLTGIGFMIKPNEEPIRKADKLLTVSKNEMMVEKTPGIAKEFVFHIGSRYIATVSKTDLQKANSIIDILPEESGWDKFNIQRAHVRVIKGNDESKESGGSFLLNEAQKALLKTADYADNLRFIAEYPGSTDKYGMNYFVTVVPEKETVYVNGNQELIAYLKENSQSIIGQVGIEQIGAGKIVFTIDANGNISDINLTNSSGHFFIDSHMLNLFSSISGHWIPAENAGGEKVEQVLEFSFGKMGC